MQNHTKQNKLLKKMENTQKNLENIARRILAEEKPKNISKVGRFHNTQIDNLNWDNPLKEWYLKAKPEYSQNLIEQYKFFNRWIHSPKRVFYPCSNRDVSPIKGFPDSEVILMDIDDEASLVMEKNKVPGYIKGNVLEYTPEKPFDLVIILNPAQRSSNLTKHLAKGGYVLANNWHNNASQILEDPNYQGIGTIDKDEKGPFLLRDFSKLEPNQFATYLYVFKNRGLEAA